MARGGSRTPSNPAPVSGPGSLSRRTDGQVQAVANVGQSPDLQYGDRQMLQGGQGVQPLAASPTVRQARDQAQARPARSGPPPSDMLFNMPSHRPDEPVSAGMDQGPGPGSEVLQTPQAPDLRTLVLQYWARNYGNEQAGLGAARVREQNRQPQPQDQSQPLEAFSG